MHLLQKALAEQRKTKPDSAGEPLALSAGKERKENHLNQVSNGHGTLRRCCRVLGCYCVHSTALNPIASEPSIDSGVHSRSAPGRTPGQNGVKVVATKGVVGSSCCTGQGPGVGPWPAMVGTARTAHDPRTCGTVQQVQGDPGGCCVRCCGLACLCGSPTRAFFLQHGVCMGQPSGRGHVNPRPKNRNRFLFLTQLVAVAGGVLIFGGGSYCV